MYCLFGMKIAKKAIFYLHKGARQQDILKAAVAWLRRKWTALGDGRTFLAGKMRMIKARILSMQLIGQDTIMPYGKQSMKTSSHVKIIQ